jgi:hypothetical protein
LDEQICMAVETDAVAASFPKGGMQALVKAEMQS